MQFYGVKHYFKNIYDTKSPCSIETQVLQDSSGSMFPYLPGTVLQKLDKQICLIYNMYKLFSNAIGWKYVYTPLLSTGILGRYFYLLGNFGSFESILQPFYIFLCSAMKFKCYPFLFVSHSILLSFHAWVWFEIDLTSSAELWPLDFYFILRGDFPFDYSYVITI